jgi:Serine/threonine protein kinase
MLSICQCGTTRVVIDEATAAAIQETSFEKKRKAAAALADRRVSNKYELQPGEELEARYNILSKIGKGGTGVVYKGEHVVLGKQVAIKVLNTELISDETAIQRFEQEARACAGLCHKNLVSVTDCGVTPAAQPYLVMEYLEGEDLMEILRKVRYLTEARFLEIFIEVCTGLAYAHNYGVIHRDLKPSNIILTTTPEGTLCPKIVDFGMAKVEEYGGQIQMLTSSGEVFGSPSYMSPEQCQGTKVDDRSDIYSLGCVMYEALMGRRAFPGDNIMAIVNMHIQQEPPALIANRDGGPISPAIAAIVLKCMNKDSSERYQSMEELKEQLLALQAREKRLVHLGSYKIGSNSLTTMLILLMVACVAGGTFLLQSHFSGDKETKLAAESEREKARMARLMWASFLYKIDMKDRYMTELTNMAKSKELSLPDKSGLVLLLFKLLDSDAKYEDEVNLAEGKLRSFFDQITAQAKSQPASLKDAASSAPLVFYYLGRAYEHRKRNELQSQDYQIRYKNLKARAAYRSGAELADALGSSNWVKGKAYAEYGESLRIQTPHDLPGSLKYLTSAIELYKGESDVELRDTRFTDLEDAYRDVAETAWKLGQTELANEYYNTLIKECENRGLADAAKHYRDELAHWKSHLSRERGNTGSSAPERIHERTSERHERTSGMHEKTTEETTEQNLGRTNPD